MVDGAWSNKNIRQNDHPKREHIIIRPGAQKEAGLDLGRPIGRDLDLDQWDARDLCQPCWKHPLRLTIPG